MTDPPAPIATSSQTLGPFFHFALAADESLGRIAGPMTPGERIRLRVRVLDGDGVPVPDALVEIHQADAAGAYAAPPSSAQAGQGAGGGFSGFGRLPTDGDGVCVFDTIKPGAVRTPTNVLAPHVNVCVLARGLLRQVYTRIYFDGDAGHAEDPILRLVPPDRVATLIATPAADEDAAAATSAPAARAATWNFIIRLQGRDETVFLDL